MRFKSSLISVILFSVIFPNLVFAYETWPSSVVGVDLSSSLRSVFGTVEPSGIVHHPRLNQLILVSDNGSVCSMNLNGSSAACTYVGGDLEGLTIVDPDTDLIYLAVEYPYQILEYNLATHALTGKRWDVPGISGATNSGIEALTYVPIGEHPYSVDDGLFYVGHQESGRVLVYQLNLAQSSVATKIAEFTPMPGVTDLAGLYYSDENKLIYGTYDAANLLIEMETDGTILHAYNEPADNQEGVAVVGTCASGQGTVYIAQDHGYIAAFAGYPMHCVVADADGDGVDSDQDCNDDDAAVSQNQTYYVDADNDSYGGATTANFCLAAAPVGHSVRTGDCDDNNAAVFQGTTYYRDADGDGMGNANLSISACSLTAPAGYVANNQDANDANTRLEYLGNQVDDDRDGQIDENNTLTQNGVHPTYGATNPMSASSFKKIVKSFSGAPNGNIIVRYADNTQYTYRVYAISTTKNTRISQFYGYLVVVNPLTNKSKWVNAYNGRVY